MNTIYSSNRLYIGETFWNNVDAFIVGFPVLVRKTSYRLMLQILSSIRWMAPTAIDMVTTPVVTPT